MRAPAAGGRKKTLRGSRLPEKGGNSRIFFPQAAFATLDWAFVLCLRWALRVWAFPQAAPVITYL